jgi:hypothetical protein
MKISEDEDGPVLRRGQESGDKYAGQENAEIHANDCCVREPGV